MSDPLEGIDRWDETLDSDGVAAEGGTPDGALRAEVLRQRIAHGLLRVAAEACDAAGRERRLGAILAAVASADALDGLGLDALDETLDDTVEVDALQPGAARVAVLRQRVVHALLRAAHDARDVVARERRVQRIVEAAAPVATPAGGAAPRDGAGGRVLRFPGRWTRVAVAAGVVIAAAVALTTLLGGRGHPLLEAAARELGKDVDRHYQLTVGRIDANPLLVKGTHELWFRPLPDGAMLFRIELDGVRSGKHRIGCDGHMVWRQNLEDGSDRESVPLEDANAMFARLAQRSRPGGEIADPGHFNMRLLLERLAGRGVAHDEGAPYRDADGKLVHLFYADCLEHEEFGTLSALLVRIDVEQRVFDVLEFTRQGPGGDGIYRFRFEYRGVDPQPDGFYRQPW